MRADLKKLYLLDTTAKTCSTIDLPVDLKKYMPADAAPMMEQLASGMKVTVTPSTETRKVKDWNATKYTLTMDTPMGASTQELWVTTEIGGDRSGWHELLSAQQPANPFASVLAAEMKKIDGYPVLSERVQKFRGSEVKSREAVISVEEKEPPPGHYDVPADFTAKPFDPMEGMPGGPRRGRMR